MQSNFYFAQYGLLQSMVCTMIDVQTNSIEASFDRKPGTDTVVYYPFDTDFNDYSGNAFHLTNNGGVEIATINGIKCANFRQISPYGLSRSSGNIITAGPYTYLCRINRTGGGQYNPRIFGGKNDWWILYIVNAGKYSVEYPNSGGGIPDSSGRHLICFTGDMSSGSFTAYKDTSLIASGTSSVKGSRTGLVIGTNESNFNNWNDGFLGQMGRTVFERRIRTFQEILTYFGKTKKHYGY